MQDKATYFSSLNELSEHLHQHRSILVTNRNVAEYPGMVLAILIDYRANKQGFELRLEWMCWGLDFYGDTLMESYSYAFNDLEKLLDYLKTKYGIALQAIAIKPSFDHKLFPSPLTHAHQEQEFKENWERFQKDFKNGALLDKQQQLVSSSI